MKLSRTASARLNAVLDDWLPPRLRDGQLFTAAARRLQGEGAIPIDEFKDRAFALSEPEFGDFYRFQSHALDQGETDLTPESADAVTRAVVGTRVLDVACGRGYLAERLAPDHQVVGCEIAVSSASPRFDTVAGSVERLPFADRSFETVVSTHTLEHVQHLALAIAELRRVCARRLVVVVPRQRPYRVTFNAHLHFFPYAWSVLAWTGTERSHSLELVGGDWLYIEEC